MNDKESEPPSPLPPGAKRITISGSSGSGKSTLGRQLSSILGIPHIEMDAIRHGPNWVETPDDIFRERVAEALQGDAWVIDGNYSVARDVVWPRATTLIWLDYSFPLVFWRLFWRTMRRGVMREELWNGNKEKLWWHFFTKNSLFLWLIQTHWRRRRSIPPALAQPEYSHLQVLHFRSARQTRRWLKEVTSAQM